jgi:peptide chain release factor 1
MDAHLKNRLVAMRDRLKVIDEMLLDEKVLSDSRYFKQLSKERATIDASVTLYNSYELNEANILDAKVMREDQDNEISAFGKAEYDRLVAEQTEIIDKIKLLLIPKDPNDDKNIVVEIRGAAGGDEAFIFASDLFRMYTKFCEANGWKIQMLSDNTAQSTVMFMVKGDAVYSKLKFESGSHRVQRVPATEASGRIHTSTATVLVMPEVEEVDIVINTSDLQVDTYRSQGAGGQNVNKTESAVRITHLPTGLVASCQIEKSQIQNRELAMKMLYAKLEAHKQAEIDEKIGNERKLKVGTGERSEKIRTYNYPQNRVTDHRIGFTIQKLDRVMEGDIEDIIDALVNYDQQQKLAGLE